MKIYTKELLLSIYKLNATFSSGIFNYYNYYKEFKKAFNITIF